MGNVFGKTDIGSKRKTNQDYILINKDLGLSLVADGMGGHKAGEVASETASKALEQYIGDEIAKNPHLIEPGNAEFMALTLERALAHVNKTVYELQQKNQKFSGMGTTLVCLWKGREDVLIGNIGDSRAYLFKAPHIWQVSEDHSLAYEQRRAGLVGAEKVIPDNVITRCIGAEPYVEPDIYLRKAEMGELYLLCSDGLTCYLKDAWLKKTLSEKALDEIPNYCINEANARGGRDNISCVVVEI